MKYFEEMGPTHLHTGVEGHRQHRHQHVSERQTDHEIVRDNAQLPMPHDGHDHKEVTANGSQDDEDHY